LEKENSLQFDANENSNIYNNDIVDSLNLSVISHIADDAGEFGASLGTPFATNPCGGPDS